MYVTESKCSAKDCDLISKSRTFTCEVNHASYVPEDIAEDVRERVSMGGIPGYHYFEDKATNWDAIELIYRHVDLSFEGITERDLIKAKLWGEDRYYAFRLKKLLPCLVEAKILYCVDGTYFTEFGSVLTFDQIKLADDLAKADIKKK